ncbi:MAG TPA: glycosyltransferase [Flavitalea sp.]|nr:glycosyltransferase [Flavitalea sp.]
MTHPKVSILIPTYNYGRFLGEAIDSVLNQSFTDFEVIIVDNNSTDNTENVAKTYLHDERVSYYKNPTNIGMVPNFNKCLEYANGEYIKYLMADDLLHPDVIAKFVHILDMHENVVLVTSDSQAFGLKTELRTSPLRFLQNGKDVIVNAIREGKGNFIGEPSTVMFRASNLQVGKFNPAYSCLGDLDFWLRQLTIGDCYFIPEVLSYFRVHEDQGSNTQNYFNWFDEYNFYKRVKTVNEYKVPQEALNIDKVIKKTSLKSASVMYRLLPDLRNKKNRTMFMRAFKIALKEKVIMSSLRIQFSKKKKSYN